MQQYNIRIRNKLYYSIIHNKFAGLIIVLLSSVLLLSTNTHGQILFYDDFDDGNADGWTEYDGVFSVLAGEYSIESISYTNDARSVIGDVSWTNYVIEVDLNVIRSDNSNTHPSILFRVENIKHGTDGGQYYQFYMYANQIGFCEINDSGGNCTILKTRSFSVPRNTWLSIKLEVKDTTVTAYINEVFALSYDGFTKYKQGSVGLKCINDGVTLFDNVVVTSLPANLSISPDPLIAGQDATFTVTNGLINTDTYLVYSLHGTGSTYVPFLNITLDLNKPKQAGDVVTTDASGNAEWVLHIPLVGLGRNVWMQACQFELKTNVVATNIE